MIMTINGEKIEEGESLSTKQSSNKRDGMVRTIHKAMSSRGNTDPFSLL